MAITVTLLLGVSVLCFLQYYDRPTVGWITARVYGQICATYLKGSPLE